jgi:hypothetical protein
MTGRRRIVALAEDSELDRIVIRHVDAIVEAHETVSDGVACKNTSRSAVSGELRIAEEREEVLEDAITRLRRADVMEERGFVASGGCACRKELELTGLEEQTWRCIGYPTPLGKIMASRHGVGLAH